MSLWNHVTTKARDDGHLVYAMDQMQLNATNGVNALPDGTCFGLAAVWLARRIVGQDYPYDAAARELRSIEPLAVKSQKAFDAQIHKQSEPWPAVTQGLAVAGLKMVQGYAQRTEFGLSASGLYNLFEKGNSAASGGNGPYLVGMRGSGGKAHAIAVINDLDRLWHLFDANYGYFRVRGNGAFKTFLTGYVSSGGTTYVATYNGGWLTAGVMPSWVPWS